MTRSVPPASGTSRSRAQGAFTHPMVGAWPPFTFRVAVVDESISARDRLARVLGPTVAWRAVTTSAELDGALDSRLDLLVTEHDLSWSDGISVIRRAHARLATLPVVVLTGRGDEQLAVRSLREGARDYLCKSDGDDELRERLLGVVSPWYGREARDPAGVAALFDTLGIGFVRTTPDGDIVDANPALVRMSGCRSTAELAAVNIASFYADAGRRAEVTDALRRRRSARGIAFVGTDAGGRRRYAQIDGRSVCDATGRTLAYEGLVRDCTEHEDSLRELAFQSAVLDRLPQAVIGLDVHLAVRYWSPHAGVHYGWSAREALGRDIFELVVPPEHRHIRERIDTILESADAHDFESEDVRKDGTRIVLHKWVTVVRDHDGTRIGTVVVAADLSDVRAKEAVLRQAVADREALIREVNHRVKNNLQVVSSLLNLQGRRVADPALRRLVRECQERIQAISAAHELLYESSGGDTLDVRTYLARLLARLVPPHQQRTTVSLGEVAQVALSVDVSISLGLIVNELILTASKRTTGDPSDQDVTVELLDAGGGLLQLRVRYDATHTAPLAGLVDVLTAQLRGVLKVDVGERTCVQVAFHASFTPQPAVGAV